LYITQSNNFRVEDFQVFSSFCNRLRKSLPPFLWYSGAKLAIQYNTPMVLSFPFFLTTFRYSVFLSLFLHCCVSLTLVPFSSTIISVHYLSNSHFLCLHFLLVISFLSLPLSPSFNPRVFLSFFCSVLRLQIFCPPLIN